VVTYQRQAVKSLRQKPIGDYIVGFYCPKAKLVLELDGGQHYSEGGHQKDGVRDKYLNSLGLQVLRFSDREVLAQTEAVLEKILSCIPL
jgi:very-short-patch-repair endonuclease